MLEAEHAAIDKQNEMKIVVEGLIAFAYLIKQIQAI